jgi:hypothetical protein
MEKILLLCFGLNYKLQNSVTIEYCHFGICSRNKEQVLVQNETLLSVTTLIKLYVV